MLGFLVALDHVVIGRSLTRQLEAELADHHLEARGDRQGEQRADDPEQGASDEQGHQDDRRRQPQHAAVDARDEDAALELLVHEHHDHATMIIAPTPEPDTATITGMLAT